MERMKHMKESLMAVVEGQMGNLHSVDAKELGEAVDMIKDLEEAIYYCTITKAMEENDKKEKQTERHYYTPMMYPYPPYPEYPMDWERDWDRDMGRMYYPQGRDSMGRFTGNGNGGRRNYDGGGQSGGSSSGGNSGGSSSSNGGGGRSYYTEREFPTEWRDSREGRSPVSRRTYMESKEMHKDKASKIKDLENYMKELSEDVVDMIHDASPEEKQVLEKKISALATKVASLNTTGA